MAGVEPERGDVIGISDLGGPVESRNIHWHDIERMIGILVSKISPDYDNILVITRGGMVPACLISERTEIRNILCAAIVFYQGQSPSLPARCSFSSRATTR